MAMIVLYLLYQMVSYSSNSADVTVLTIEAVNDAPVLATVSDVSFDEDGSGSVNLSADDVDGDALEYAVSGGSSITADLDVDTITFTAPVDYNGSEQFTVSVTDGEYIASQVITVVVNAVNDPPVLASIGDRVIDEDGVLSILLSANDIEGDQLSYSISEGVNVTAGLSDNELTLSPSQDFNGTESFTVTVNDGDLEDSETFTLTVNAVNDAPVLATVSDVSFDEDGSGSISLSADDVDGDDLSYSITGGADITATLDGSDVAFSAPADFNGSEQFTVTVTDGSLDDSQTFSVTVNAVNDAPVADTASATTDEDVNTVVPLYYQQPMLMVMF